MRAALLQSVAENCGVSHEKLRANVTSLARFVRTVTDTRGAARIYSVKVVNAIKAFDYSEHLCVLADPSVV